MVTSPKKTKKPGYFTPAQRREYSNLESRRTVTVYTADLRRIYEALVDRGLASRDVTDDREYHLVSRLSQEQEDFLERHGYVRNAGAHIERPKGIYANRSREELIDHVLRNY